MNEYDKASWQEALRRLVGELQAQEIISELEKLGIDPAAADMPSMLLANPQLGVMFQQFVTDSAANNGVNWQATWQLARQQVGRKTDPVPTASQARQVHEAFSRSNLWLDAVSDFSPPPPRYETWSRQDWLDKTAKTWEEIVGPLAAGVSASLEQSVGGQLDNLDEDHLPEQIRSALGALGLSSGSSLAGSVQNMMHMLSANMFALQLGLALSSLAGECFGSTDIGLPLGQADQGALVISNVEEFGHGLAQTPSEVLAFLATREAAYQRLYHGVPWLRHHVLQAIKDFASGITFDLDQISDLAQREGFNPEQILGSFEPGMLKPQLSQTQNAALERLEVILALMEGWVEEVSAAALAPYLPSVGALREMMRRRRATGGPAEQTFASLIGLHLRPKRVREAASMWAKIYQQAGAAGREKLWSHPDWLPQVKDMDNLGQYLEKRLASEQEEDELAKSLNALLDGSLGYAAGLAPGDDSAGDADVTKQSSEGKTGKDTTNTETKQGTEPESKEPEE